MEVIGRKVQVSRTSIEAMLGLDKDERIKHIDYNIRLSSNIIFETYYVED